MLDLSLLNVDSIRSSPNMKVFIRKAVNTIINEDSVDVLKEREC